jgi:hypothetical protein
MREEGGGAIALREKGGKHSRKIGKPAFKMTVYSLKTQL